MEKPATLKEFQDKASKEIFGSTQEEALIFGLCISCKEEALPKCYSKAGKREFRISGLCEMCFDEITKE